MYLLKKYLSLIVTLLLCASVALHASNLKPPYIQPDQKTKWHVLYEVDLKFAIRRYIKRYRQELKIIFRQNKMRYRGFSNIDNGLQIKFNTAEHRKIVSTYLELNYPEFAISSNHIKKQSQGESNEFYILKVILKAQKIEQLGNEAVMKNLCALRFQMNYLRITNPVVIRKGKKRILVHFPQNREHLIGFHFWSDKIIRVESRNVFKHSAAYIAGPFKLGERPPPGTQLFKLSKTLITAERKYILLEREVIWSSHNIVSATIGPYNRMDDSSLRIDVILDDSGWKHKTANARKNLHKKTAILYIEPIRKYVVIKGAKKLVNYYQKTVINIQPISSSFMHKKIKLTKLGNYKRVHKLALHFCAGSSMAPMTIINTRDVGLGE